MVEAVTAFMNENVLHSKLYDQSDDVTKLKVVNQASNTLVKYMPDVYSSVEEIPLDELSEQVLWLLKMDDSMQRAEMGAIMITVDGVTIQLRDMDRTISPKILSLHGRTSTRKRKVASYAVPLQDTNRMGNVNYKQNYWR
ncbi:hypothetical protein [Bacillus sp. NPDC077027]|uniref:hypothetical protein n=1 Tax=Bacillus sp. NPDC077027 TaxID=3390548 RepID=UPI003CFE0771